MMEFELKDKVLEKTSGVAKEATVPDGVTIIGDGAFMHKIRLESLFLPDGVTRIEEFAFYNCRSLSSLTLPKSLMFIGKSAFKKCEKLHDIVFGGTIAQWKEIKKEETFFETGGEPAYVECEWDYYLGFYTVHCADGDISTQ